MMKRFCLLVALSLSASLPASSTPQTDPLEDARLDVDHLAEIAAREADDARLEEVSRRAGLHFEKTVTPSRADDLQIPIYIFEPATPTRAKGSLVWLYGGIHDRFGTNYFPFIREAVGLGFRVVVPEYRGARGYGSAFYDAMDYGGYEVDDALAAADLAADRGFREESGPAPVSIIGWSHGGLIALLAAARAPHRFENVVASVPVSNLVVRMAYKGPSYHRLFSQQPRIGGPVHERLQTYLDRSPLYQVKHLKARIMVQLATNDDDVSFIEAEPLADALRQKLKNRAQVLIFEDPPHGHYFNRQVDLETLSRRDTPAQIKSWEAIWKFLEIQ